MKTIYALLGAGAVLFGSTPAFCAFPDSVVGTWNAILNQTAKTIVINTQRTAGKCKSIAGTIQGTTNLQGFYCPATGRIFFVRKFVSNNDTSQVCNGNLATDAALDRMSGTFADLNSKGEFGWSASK
jgi:hypothetical protein